MDNSPQGESSREGRPDNESQGKAIASSEEREDKRRVGVGKRVEDGRLSDQTEEEEQATPRIGPLGHPEGEEKGMPKEKLLESGTGDEESLEDPTRAALQSGHQGIYGPSAQEKEPSGEEEESAASNQKRLACRAEGGSYPCPADGAGVEDERRDRRQEQGCLHSAKLSELEEEGGIGKQGSDEESARN